MLCTSYHCVVDTGITKGSTVAIWGMGPVGLMCAHFSFQKGASRVIGIDNSWRLGWCKTKIPKLETLDYARVPLRSSISTELRRMVSGEGVDFALQCAATERARSMLHKLEMALRLEDCTSETLNEMILSVKQFGTIGITGVYAGYTNHVNIGAVMQLGIRIIGNSQAPVSKYWKELLEQIRSGDVDPSIMISHRIDLDDLPKAYRIFDSKQQDSMKTFVQTRFSNPPAPGTLPVVGLQA